MALLAPLACGEAGRTSTTREGEAASAQTPDAERRIARAARLPQPRVERSFAVIPTHVERREQPMRRLTAPAVAPTRESELPRASVSLPGRTPDPGPGAHYALGVEIELFDSRRQELEGALSLIRCTLHGPEQGSFGLGGVRIAGLPAEFDSELDGGAELVLFGEALLRRSDHWSSITLQGSRVSGLVRTLAVEVEEDDGRVAFVRERRLRIDPSESNELLFSPDEACPDELTLHLVLEEQVDSYVPAEGPGDSAPSLQAAFERTESREVIGRGIWTARWVSDTPEIIEPGQRREFLRPAQSLRVDPDRLRNPEPYPEVHLELDPSKLLRLRSTPPKGHEE